MSPVQNCVIDGITKGSTAANSELQVGDIIVSINYQKVKTTKEIENVMQTTGESIILKIHKKGKYQEGYLIYTKYFVQLNSYL